MIHSRPKYSFLPQVRASEAPAGGFTLIELLIVIAIIGVLAGILLSVLSSIQTRANTTKEISNLRQIGAAMLAYVGDNNGTLPGPSYSGTTATYFNNSRNLPYYLASYLNLTLSVTPQIAQLFVNPNFYRQKPNPGVTGTANLVNYLANNQTTGLNSLPFGNTGSNPMLPGMPLALVAAEVPLATTWALCDVDQQVVRVQSAGWSTTLSRLPVNGNVREYLYFDGHVASRPASVQP